MKTFENVQVNDQVYCLLYGNGEIIYRNKIVIEVLFINGLKVDYDFSGRIIDGNREIITPTLYWSKPEISNPPAPKRLVEKTFTKYVNIYRNNKCSRDERVYLDKNYILGGRYFNSEEEAVEEATVTAVLTGVEVLIKFKVEE